MTQVKICGIRTPEHALAASEAGADLIGLNFAESRRRVTPGEAAAIVAAVRSSKGPRPKFVGVFVDTGPNEVNAIATEVGLDLVQLSGSINEAFWGEIGLPVIQAVHVRPRPQGKEIQALRERLGGMTSQGVTPLLDTALGGQPGGTGRAFDWGAIEGASTEYDFMLAGGLTPQNVGEAVRVVRPWGVDVSTGVETNGVKDPERVRAFILEVRRVSG